MGSMHTVTGILRQAGSSNCAIQQVTSLKDKLNPQMQGVQHIKDNHPFILTPKNLMSDDPQAANPGAKGVPNPQSTAHLESPSPASPCCHPCVESYSGNQEDNLDYEPVEVDAQFNNRL